MAQWLIYFLAGVEQTATRAVQTLSQVLELKTRIESEIQQHFGRRAHSALTFLQALFIHPVTNVDRVQQECNLSYKAANALIGAMQTHGYLRELTGQSRNRIFVFQPYLDAFDDE